MSKRFREEVNLALKTEEQPFPDTNFTIQERRIKLPLVWKRTTSGIRIQDLQEKYYDEVMEMIKEYFIPNEILCSNTNFAEDEVSVNSFMNRMSYQLKESCSIIAVDETFDFGVQRDTRGRVIETKPYEEGPIKIVGCLVLKAENKADLNRTFSNVKLIQGEAMQKYIDIKSAVNRKANVFESMDCEKSLCFYELCVLPDYRHKSIGFTLMTCGLSIARSFNMPVVSGVFTTGSLRKIAKKLGMRLLSEVQYARWLDDEHELIFDDPGPGNYSCVLMAGYVRPLPSVESLVSTPIVNKNLTRAEKQSDVPQNPEFMMYKCFIITFCIFFCSVALYESAPEVTISQGRLRGRIRKTWKGKSFMAFQSIPYAKPPLGHLRFREPLPLETWEGVLDATHEHAMCPQTDSLFHLFDVDGDENCLFLNVYTPQIVKSKLLPVIVFIHGGGFVLDSGNPSLYGPDILLDKDIVLVTLNYRLGVLGFLSTEDEVVPGNNGLKDQNLALKWVKDNIVHFGGNYDKVTLFGQSAGGASVYYHTLSPLSKDLLFAAISSSGISLASWALAEEGESKREAKRLAEFLDCPTTSSQAIVDCLRRRDASEIVKATKLFAVYNYDPLVIFKPIVESVKDGAFLPEHPLDIIKDDKIAQIPFMTGVTTAEGAMKSAAIYNDSSLVKQLNMDFNKYAPVLLDYEHLYFGQNTDDFSNEIRKFYFDDKPIDNTTKAAVTDMVSDSLFLYPARFTSVLHSKYSRSPVYFYLFDYRGTSSYSELFGDATYDYGVSHCDDLIYLLSADVLEYTPSEADLNVTDLMTTLWYNFANTGNPTPDVNSSISVRWNPVTSDNLEYYHIRKYDEIEMQKNLYEDRYTFWRHLEIFRNTTVKHE
ncbi:hypothetical protein FQA39_LY03768 [Lamprigera yunnana]|nr:hypothetical protein FQA39_LY03768 [Lamprigera yunnana]